MAREAEKNGVKYVCGRSGTAVRLIYDDTNGTCTGVLTADGSTHTADLVILANGAQIPMLIEARDEVEASGSAVAVIELTPEEAEKYKDIPIIDDFDQGQPKSNFFYRKSNGDCSFNTCMVDFAGIIFPPDHNRLVKICSCRFLVNYKNNQLPGASVGVSHSDRPHDGIPDEIDKELRDFLYDMAPDLANKPWVTTRMCW